MLNITRSLKYIIKKYNKILYLNIYMLVIIGSLLISKKPWKNKAIESFDESEELKEEVV